MREIELKAHAGDYISVRKNLEKLYGEGKEVHKSDHYFRRPGESIQAMRIRSYNGIIEMTCKKTSVDGNGENNFEYEFQSSPDQLEPAIRFFHALGLEDFFIKKKDGLEWYGDGACPLMTLDGFWKSRYCFHLMHPKRMLQMQAGISTGFSIARDCQRRISRCVHTVR